MLDVRDVCPDCYDVVEVVALVLNRETGYRMKFEQPIDPPNYFSSQLLAERRMKEVRRKFPGRWFKVQVNGGKPTKRY